MPKMVYDLPQVEAGSPGTIPQVSMSGPQQGLGENIAHTGRVVEQGYKEQAQNMRGMAEIEGQMREVAMRVQNDIDDAKAKAADNALEQALTTHLYDAENGFLAKEGEGAMLARPVVLKNLQDTAKEIEKTLENPVQKVMFQKVMQQRMNQAAIQINSHTIAATKAFHREQAAMRKALAKEAAKRKAKAGRGGPGVSFVIDGKAELGKYK